MLKRLHISNYALIEQVNVTFPSRLTVVTGETGAGKSIFLEALSLVLGERADVNSLHDKTKKCIIEAEFDISGYKLKEFFKTHELDYEEQTILRREINPEGKSRGFINDSPASIQLLKQLGEKLVDIHSQHETLMLNESSFRFEAIDAFAGSQDLLNKYREQYFLSLSKRKLLAELQQKELQAKKDLDYYQFLFTELEEANVKNGELKILEEESSTLENAELIKSGLLRSAAIINEGETNLLSGLSQIKQQLQQLVKFSEVYKTFSERVNSLYIEAKELASDLEDAESNIVFNTARLEEVNTQLDKLNRLLKKHGVTSEEELLKIKSDIEEKLQQFGSLENDIEKLNRELVTLSKELERLSAELSGRRKNCTNQIETDIKKTLTSLSMPNAVFKIEVSPLNDFGPYGTDQVKFLFSANKGNEFRELHKVASGGELSRLMLSLKSLLASKKSLPTIIFDEIDTGVSGDVADKIGQILTKMSQSMQVISITHLPQIASKGNFHLFVYKEDRKEKTISFIKELSADERVVEIAKMLSTGTPTSSAIKNAKDLLNAN
jgi:DNA repair protein RecN (Recombination protein N)